MQEIENGEGKLRGRGTSDLKVEALKADRGFTDMDGSVAESLRHRPPSTNTYTAATQSSCAITCAHVAPDLVSVAASSVHLV